MFTCPVSSHGPAPQSEPALASSVGSPGQGSGQGQIRPEASRAFHNESRAPPWLEQPGQALLLRHCTAEHPERSPGRASCCRPAWFLSLLPSPSPGVSQRVCRAPLGLFTPSQHLPHSHLPPAAWPGPPPLFRGPSKTASAPQTSPSLPLQPHPPFCLLDIKRAENK